MLVTVLAIFDHQHPLSPNIRGGQQHPNDVTKIWILSPTLSHKHHNVNNMTVAALGPLGSVNYAGLSVPEILILRCQDIYNQNIW